MDFLEKATKKLDVQDKLPGQLRDKLPGEKAKTGEGKHLAGRSNQDHEDGAGFPHGLRPSDWMGDLIDKNLAPATALITEFRYPGAHDAATYGSGLESFSYQCQEKNFYEQMMTGQRCFDLRLAPVDNGHKFIPVHGIAKNTANDFNSGPKKAEKDDLAAQIMRFAKEHPKEILIFQCRVEGMKEVKAQFSEMLWSLLGERLLESPSEGRPVPTYEEAVRSNRNIVFGLQAKLQGPVENYIWNVGRETPCWHGDGDELLWNEPTWQSGDIKKVLRSVEDYMHKNEAKTAQREKFWVAYLQLTPALGQGFSTFIKDGGSVRPKDLALGGGMGTHGEFEGSNQQLRESNAFKQDHWKKNASCLLYDFCDTKTSGDIVAMNIGADFKGRGRGGGGAGVGAGAGAGGAQEGREDHPGRGDHMGRGGRGGGRGGRGGHEGEGRREEEELREEGEHAGRGAHRGGRGRGRGDFE